MKDTKNISVNEKISLLREEMKKENIDFYIIPTNDYHSSEYVAPFFKSREFMSGFTGSAGTLAVCSDKTYLWADGRYFIQAANQIEGSEIILNRIGEPGVPTLDEFVKENISGKTLGFDGKVVTAAQGTNWAKLAEKYNGNIRFDLDLVDRVWASRPALPSAKTFTLEEKFAGEKVSSKLHRLREKLKSCYANCQIITALDEIAWLFNIRGGDVLHTPVFLSYLLVFDDSCKLYMDKEKLDDASISVLKANAVEVLPYEQIYSDIKLLNSEKSLLVDTGKLNFSLLSLIPNDVTQIKENSPISLMKALKNPIEQENIRQAYIKDGVACTKFMYWLKNNVGKIPMDEISVADYLESLRRENNTFIDLSFETICGYKEHAAMMHYSADDESKYEIKNESMLLVDSGAHYYEGTTDITRTYILGEVPLTLKIHFTTVLKSMLALTRAKFLEGVTGGNLDILARGPVWQMGIDYKCGTGHGVGYVLSVHEGPASFRWQTGTDMSANVPLQEGMTLTNEPGIYIEGSHGIRLENQLIVKKAEKTVFGQFMSFETVTLCPLDLDGVIPTLLSSEERDTLNEYHEKVFEKISPYLTEDERDWLARYTRKI